MKTRLFAAILMSGFAAALFAQAPKPAPAKSPASLALDEFNKARSEPGAKNQARFQKVINAGLAYLTQYPTDGNVSGAINNLAFYAGSIDKKEAAQRTAYVSLLKLEVMNQKYKDGVSDNAKAVLAATEAAIADFDARESITAGTLGTLREKTEELASTPGGNRFLAERERSYLHLVAINAPARAEEQAKKLLEHKEKAVKDMAREELNILEVKKQPYDLKLTSVDGKPIDFSQLRGKVVAFYFWSAANKGSTDRLDQVRQIYSDYKKKGFELVTVSYDKEEDRAKLMKYMKDNKVTFPVYFDGKGTKNDFGPKLNVWSVPRLMVFDQKGILFTTVSGSPVGRLTPNLEVNQLEGVTKALLAKK